MNFQKIHLLNKFSSKIKINKSIHEEPIQTISIEDSIKLAKELQINPKDINKFAKLIRIAYKENLISKDPYVIYYHSKSASKPPGKGTKERIGSEDSGNWKKVSDVSNFRQVLSNLSPGIVKWKFNKEELNDQQKEVMSEKTLKKGYLTFDTIEHGFHFGKFWFNGYYKDAMRLTKWYKGQGKIESDGLSARKARKLVKLEDNELKNWNKLKFPYIEELIISRGENDEKFRNLLLNTGNSLLIHGFRMIPILPELPIMRARKRLVSKYNQKNPTL